MVRMKTTARETQRGTKTGPYLTPREMKSGGSLGRYVTLLLCKHVVYYDPPPTLKDTVYCRRCGDYQGVEVVNLEFSIHCRGCNMRRRYGTDEAAARVVMARHVRRYPGHSISLYNGNQLVSILSDRQPKLPKADI